MNAYSDDAILDLIGSGSELGLQALLQTHGGHVRVLLLETFGVRFGAEVEHAIQHAVQIIWHQHDTYDPSQGSLRDWFFALARTALLGLMRLSGRGGWE